MSADNRPVTTDALETLGTIIGSAEARDAIHLAVEPVEAGEALMPGEHIGLFDGRAWKKGTFYHNYEGGPKVPIELLGIVDPFLPAPVKAGERFWLVVYPRQITSLRHVWTHPAFPEAEVPATGTKAASEQWMRKWAMEHMSTDYWGDGDAPLSEDAAYDNAIRAGHDNHVGSYEDARDHIDGEWWTHWETITGKKGDRDAYFSCSC